MDDSIFYAAFMFPSAAAVIIFFMKYISAVLQARGRLAQDETYRELAARAVSVQMETSAALQAIQSQLAAVEKILNAVG